MRMEQFYGQQRACLASLATCPQSRARRMVPLATEFAETEDLCRGVLLVRVESGYRWQGASIVRLQKSSRTSKMLAQFAILCCFQRNRKDFE